MKYRKINIEDDNWTSLHDLEERIPFSFSPGGKDKTGIELKGVRLGNLDESMAIPVKVVKHDFMEEDGYRVDASSVIPFGSEPYISRTFEYMGNIIKVTSDIRVKAPINGNVFSVDDLVLKGKWKKFAFLDKKPGSKIRWEKIAAGYYFASGGIYLRPRELTKIGYLLLNEGSWDNSQIITKEWISESIAPHIQTDDLIPQSESYGYQWWIKDFHANNQTYECFFAAGWGDQFMFIFPDPEMIITINSGNFAGTSKMSIFKFVENHILSGLL
jgi:CubicO group peptidase (beta-lactamase class C family)